MYPRPQQVPVLILGHTVTALGVLRSLGRAGVPTRYLCRKGDFARWSRWARPLPVTLPETCSVEELGAFLQGLPFDRLVLMPCSDWWAHKVAQLDPALSERFPYAGSPAAVGDRLTDKLRFAELAGSQGIPHPRTVRVDRLEDLSGLVISPEAGCFIKPHDSQAFTTALGTKAFLVSSIQEAQERLAQAWAVGQGVMLQEYIPGPATNHYFLDGFVDRHGVVRARFARQRLRMHPLPFGNSTYMRSIPLDDVPDIVQTIDRLVAVTGLRGIFSVELKRDPRDGVAKVLDVNIRPWWFVEFASACGVNVCEMAYRAALGAPVAAVTSYAEGRTCIFPYLDFAACRRLQRAGELTLASWGRSWLKSKGTIFSIDDPLPFLHCYAVMLLGVLQRSPGRILRRLRRRLHTLLWHRHSSVPASSAP
jgi:predicted ATP-grasp superfamily ATP-dependent carboligase